MSKYLITSGAFHYRFETLVDAWEYTVRNYGGEPEAGSDPATGASFWRFTVMGTTTARIDEVEREVVKRPTRGRPRIADELLKKKRRPDRQKKRAEAVLRKRNEAMRVEAKKTFNPDRIDQVLREALERGEIT